MDLLGVLSEGLEPNPAPGPLTAEPQSLSWGPGSRAGQQHLPPSLPVVTAMLIQPLRCPSGHRLANEWLLSAAALSRWPEYTNLCERPLASLLQDKLKPPCLFWL